jgi:drug/metabolite transporter (DMT)-like permease
MGQRLLSQEEIRELAGRRASIALGGLAVWEMASVLPLLVLPLGHAMAVRVPYAAVRAPVLAMALNPPDSARRVMPLGQQTLPQLEMCATAAPLEDGEWTMQADAMDDADAPVARARATLAMVAAAYGSNYAMVKLIDVYTGSASLGAAIRFLIAAAVMVPPLVALGRKEPRLVQWPIASSGLGAGACFAAGYAVQASALETSDAGLQAFLLSLAVVVCPLLERLVAQRAQPPQVWLAAGLAACGVLVLECGAPSGFGAAPGDVLGLLQPLLFGAGFFQVERAMATHAQRAPPVESVDAFSAEPTSAEEPSSADPSSADIPPSSPLAVGPWAVPFAISAWQMLSVCVATSTWAVVDVGGERVASSLSALLTAPSAQPELALAVVWCGLATTALTSFLEAEALGALSSSEATVIYASEPLWGAGFAFAVLGETLAPSTLLGGAFIVLACLTSATPMGAALVATLGLEQPRAIEAPAADA